MIVYQTYIVTCGPVCSFPNHAFSLQQLTRLYIVRQVFISLRQLQRNIEVQFLTVIFSND